MFIVIKLVYNIILLFIENFLQINEIIYLSEELVKSRTHIRDIYEKNFSVSAFYKQMEIVWSQLDIQRGKEQ